MPEVYTTEFWHRQLEEYIDKHWENLQFIHLPPIAIGITIEDKLTKLTKLTTIGHNSRTQ
jgi:hypothetical protein